MEGGIFLCHWYFLLKARTRRRRDGNRQPQDGEAEPSDVEEGADENSSNKDKEVPLNPIFSSTSDRSIATDTEAQENETKIGWQKKDHEAALLHFCMGPIHR